MQREDASALPGTRLRDVSGHIELHLAMTTPSPDNESRAGDVGVTREHPVYHHG
jgi:hypothetical protein